MTVSITPMGAVRMTRAYWTAPAQRYFAWKDDLRKKVDETGGYAIGDTLSLRFTIPMPASWSKKKRAEMLGKPHQSKPDLDNLIKAFKDALCTDDAHVWSYGRMEKVWGEEGSISELS